MRLRSRVLEMALPISVVRSPLSRSSASLSSVTSAVITRSDDARCLRALASCAHPSNALSESLSVREWSGLLMRGPNTRKGAQHAHMPRFGWYALVDGGVGGVAIHDVHQPIRPLRGARGSLLV